MLQKWLSGAFGALLFGCATFGFAVQGVIAGEVVQTLTPGVADNQSQNQPAQNGTYSVRDYGAKGDGVTNDSAAFQKALDTIATAGKGTLYIPAGDYRIEEAVTRIIGTWNLVIKGDGQGVSNLYSYNNTGIFKFVHTTRSPKITISELSFWAAQPDAGTAIDIFAPEGGNRHDRSLLIENVELRSVNIREHFFNNGIKAIGQWRPLFLNVVVGGPFGPGVPNITETSPQYKMDIGIQADGSYAPSFQHTYVWSAKLGYSVKSTQNPGPEDAAFYRAFAVGVITGILLSTPGQEPQVVIDAAHINARDIGIKIEGRKFVTIVNCLMYNDDFSNIAPGYTDIELSKASGVIIANNIFHQPGNRNRKMIDIKASVSDVMINGNYFNASGTAINTTFGTRNIVAKDNVFTAQVTKTLNDPAKSVSLETKRELRNVLVSRSEAQLIPDSNWTSVAFDTLAYDNGGLWTYNNTIVVPANKDIRYVRLTANINWADNNKGVLKVEFTKNGSEAFPGNGTSVQGAGAPVTQSIQSAIIPVSAGDLLGVRVYQSSGKELQLGPDGKSWFAVEVIEG